MNRYRTGALAWMASTVIFPVQLLVALRWPQGYSLRDNAISDLGVTGCGLFSEQGQLVRNVCSPWHPLFNLGLVGSGVLIVLGAVLLQGWWDTRSGRAGTLLMVLVGILISVVGLAPWDAFPELHDGVALGQAVAQWLAMVLLAVSAGPGRFRRLTLVVVVVSIVGFTAFLAALDGPEVPWLGLGGTERVSFDTLSLWTALVGVALLTGRGLRDEARVPAERSSVQTQ